MGAVLSGLQFWYTRGTPTVQGVYLLLQTAVCAGLLAFLIIRGRSARDTHLLWLAYALLALCAALCIVSLPVPIHGWAGTVTTPASTAVRFGPAKTPDAAIPNIVVKSAASTDANMLTTRPPKSKGKNSKRINLTEAPALPPQPPLPPPRPIVAAAEGLWPIVFATFVAYALLPLPTWLAGLFGVLMGCVHLTITAILPVALPSLSLQQLAGNCLVLLAVNAVGLFLHTATEAAQRRAFLDTRNCIAARLEIEDENEKLERLLLSVLPQHVAVEMKADLMAPVEGQFHKIYIQRHENVSILYVDRFFLYACMRCGI